MTKEQAYEKLELPVGTDLQVVRQKFNQMHNEFLMQIDGVSFNPAMKQRKEQQLEELKEAYKLLNESDSIDDSASRPYTGKTFDHGGTETRSSSSEPSKPKGQQAPPPPPPPREETYQPREQAPPVYSAPPEKKKSNAGLFVGIAAGAIIVLAGAYFMANRSDIGNPSASETNNTEASRDSATWETVLFANDSTTYQHYIDNFPNGIFAQAAKDSIARLQTATVDDTPIATAPSQDNEITQQFAAQQERIKQLEQDKKEQAEALARQREARERQEAIRNKQETTPKVDVNWEANYEEVGPVYGDRRKVIKNGKQGYVSLDGQVIIPPIYDGFFNSSSHVNRLPAKKGELAGLIDTKTGKELTPFIYDHIQVFNEGLATFRLPTSSGGGTGYMDINGNEVIPAVYSNAWSFYDGLAIVDKGRRYGVINKNQNEIIPFGKYTIIHNLHGGRLNNTIPNRFKALTKDGNWILINEKDEFLKNIDVHYQE
ncbi:WG repeat-containing protein [Sphingobacterium sp. DN00404]|uniref:WG repeat-containing protein n=1 Tax=Sphingobacterium micropteri TaxID=2763501 RepID=A0ABR7YRC9_9SPHI|nr:WG repeat-containing protein [Sphingobacterium micropteri]MBD1433904.1 WG repeat-containing protein [Sphingobacterium micropteri]